VEVLLVPYSHTVLMYSVSPRFIISRLPLDPISAHTHSNRSSWVLY